MGDLGWRWVRQVLRLGGRPSLEMFDGAVAAGDAAIPLMTDVLSRRDWRLGDDPDRAEIHVHALRLLGEIGSPRALPALIGVVHDSVDVARFGDEAGLALARLGSAALPSLGRVLASRDADRWPRAVAARALEFVALRDRRLRPDVIPLLESLIEDAGEGDRVLNSHVAHALRQLASARSLSVIDKAFRAGRVDEDMSTWNDLLIDVVARHQRPDADDKALVRRDVRDDYRTLDEILAGLDRDLAREIADDFRRWESEPLDAGRDEADDGN